MAGGELRLGTVATYIDTRYVHTCSTASLLFMHYIGTLCGTTQHPLLSIPQGVIDSGSYPESGNFRLDLQEDPPRVQRRHESQPQQDVGHREGQGSVVVPGPRLEERTVGPTVERGPVRAPHVDS